MSPTFIDYLQEKGTLTREDLELIATASISKRVRKGQYLLEEGEVSDFVGFVVKGSFRLFRMGDDQEEHMMRFAIENWWVSDFISFMSGQPSNCYLEALEDSEIIRFSKEKWEELLAASPNFRRIIEALTAKNFEAHQNRIFSNISDPAEVRYEKFVQQYPNLYNRIPLYMIASFLGLTRETLSRVRKQAVKRSQVAS
ncbi:Crp/Fnr family transcriptional regulator [Mucilaginibacter sabulilitoris]|uniref:Crp/Fnr family transcriptional regulator n=1 Tax=Mucilaginibacter sabulilitoris TaxID=1173583 RepID=A0ABZ0TRH6_9SPHI|nr:Crp/Fnr family transcriptional regulator [Mucilaginibacter sabulilitoris]WPU95728.1 Crp/Fnr family transcriptional regulator [Mucilaginibacter sabulilitoris]